MLYHHGFPQQRNLLTLEKRAWIAGLKLPAAAREQLTISLQIIDALDLQLVPFDHELRAYARKQTGCRTLVREIYGVGELTAVTILAELGDPRRFQNSRDVVRYSGLVSGTLKPPRAPTHRGTHRRTMLARDRTPATWNKAFTRAVPTDSAAPARDRFRRRTCAVAAIALATQRSSRCGRARGAPDLRIRPDASARVRPWSRALATTPWRLMSHLSRA